MESKSSLVPSLVSFCVQLTQNKNKVLIFFRIFGVLAPLSAISWRPVLVVEEAGVLGDNW
jgi:hypothetical protein